MNKTSPQILSLRREIETTFSRLIKTPADFEWLAGVIWERLHENISPTTLKRLWGYIDGANTTRRSTLCLLSRLLGYQDWEQYLQHLTAQAQTESDTFTAEGIRTDDLSLGDRVEVCWLPNRRCVFRYEGGNKFVVEISENSKLQAGDHFDAACFLVGKPMFLDNLQRADSEPTAYVAGTKSGIVSVKKI